MNHYERLNVTPDASIDVIRAAYRALATKLHPDRQGGNAGPNEQAHEEMAALNASYLVLTNVKARANYDAQLRAESASRHHSSQQRSKDPSQQSGAHERAQFFDDGFAQTMYEPYNRGEDPRRHDGAAAHAKNFSWMNGNSTMIDSMAKRADASPLPRWAWALLFSSLLTACLMIWVMTQKSEAQSFESGLSEASQSELDARSALPPTQAAKPKLPVISEEELSKLSNEELLARMPALIGESVLPEDKALATDDTAYAEPALGVGRSLQLKQSMELGGLQAASENP